MVIAQEGHLAKLECEASQYSQLATPIEFEWFKNGVRWSDPSRAYLRAGKYRGTLTFASVEKTASALYTCKARGVRGLSNSSVAITLNVTCKFVVFLALNYIRFCYKDPPQNVKVKSNFSAFAKEGRVILSCITEANPLPHQYSWWKDGQPQAGSGSQFVILNSSFSGNETYQCAATNSLDSSMSEKFVFSLSKPRLLAVLRLRD